MRDGRAWRWVPVAAYMGFIFWLSSQSSPGMLGDLELNDKLKHLLLYSAFSVLVWWALEPRLGRRPLAHALWTVAFVSFYGATDEFHQLFTPGRSADVADWVADTAAGVVVATGLTLWVRRTRRPVLRTPSPDQEAENEASARR
jgi:hypothetical protein